MLSIAWRSAKRHSISEMRESLDGGAIGERIAFLHMPSISESLIRFPNLAHKCLAGFYRCINDEWLTLA